VEHRLIRFFCDTCNVEVPIAKVSKEHTCSWCGAHSCMDHMLVDVWGAAACIRCAQSRLIRVRKATQPVGEEQLLGSDYKP
jgi:hypothetical protein